MTGTHDRNPPLRLLLDSGAARIPQALGLKVLDVRLVDGTAEAFDDKNPEN